VNIRRVNVLGVGISVLNLESARRAVMEALEGGTKGYICVTGVHGVSEAQEDAAFRSILNRAFLCVPDGMPMVWAGKAAGFAEMGRVYGPDLMREVCQSTAATGHSHFLLGGGAGVAEELKGRLERRFPGIRVAGAFTPPFRPMNEEEEQRLIAMVRDCKPSIVWIGLSTPKQERFMAAYLERLDATLLCGVGAAFDFFTGRVKQAPFWVQRSGLEWLFRLCQEPRRLWRRYFRNNPRFVFRILCQAAGIHKYPLE